MNDRSPTRSRESGQGLAEFAMTIPILILVIVAIFDLGRGVFVYNSVTNGAREAVRLAIVNQTQASVIQRGVSQVAIAETGSPNITVAYRRATPNADPELNAVCTPIQIGCLAVVTFETDYQPITPLVKQIVFSSGVKLVAKSVLAVEFICPNTVTTAANCPKQP